MGTEAGKQGGGVGGWAGKRVGEAPAGAKKGQRGSCDGGWDALRGKNRSRGGVSVHKARQPNEDRSNAWDGGVRKDFRVSSLGAPRTTSEPQSFSPEAYMGGFRPTPRGTLAQRVPVTSCQPMNPYACQPPTSDGWRTQPKGPEGAARPENVHFEHFFQGGVVWASSPKHWLVLWGSLGAKISKKNTAEMPERPMEVCNQVLSPNAKPLASGFLRTLGGYCVPAGKCWLDAA